MDVIETLTTDHRTVEDLYGRFKDAAGAEQREQLGRQIVRELSIHAAVEEQFVYPLIRLRVDDGRDRADEAIEEHQEIKRLLADLEKMDPGSVEYGHQLDAVMKSVDEHVQEEEGTVFPKLREASGTAERDRVGTLVDEARGLVPTHPHPNVPGTATAQLVAGPWATLVDKTRDLFGR